MNKENVIRIIEMKLDSLKEQERTGESQEDNFGKAVAQLEIDGEITRQDILDIQNNGLRGGDVLDILVHLDPNSKSGLTWYEAREQGHKVQFIYLSYYSSIGRTDGENLFKESMDPHEKAIDDIYNGIYDQDKLLILQSLPSIDKWDNDLGADAYHKIF